MRRSAGIAAAAIEMARPLDLRVGCLSDPRDAISHGYVDSQKLLAWQSTNASMADFDGFPSSVIEGTYREGDMTLNTSPRRKYEDITGSTGILHVHVRIIFSSSFFFLFFFFFFSFFLLFFLFFLFHLRSWNSRKATHVSHVAKVTSQTRGNRSCHNFAAFD